MSAFYAPNFEKLRGHIALGISVHPFVHAVKKIKLWF